MDFLLLAVWKSFLVLGMSLQKREDKFFTAHLLLSKVRLGSLCGVYHLKALHCHMFRLTLKLIFSYRSDGYM